MDEESVLEGEMAVGRPVLIRQLFSSAPLCLAGLLLLNLARILPSPHPWFPTSPLAGMACASGLAALRLTPLVAWSAALLRRGQARVTGWKHGLAYLMDFTLVVGGGWVGVLSSAGGLLLFAASYILLSTALQILLLAGTHLAVAGRGMKVSWTASPPVTRCFLRNRYTARTTPPTRTS